MLVNLVMNHIIFFIKAFYICRVEQLCKKLTKRIGLLRSITQYFPLNERILFYNTTIKPIFLYCGAIWSSTSKCNIRRIFRLQKRVARVILGRRSVILIRAGERVSAEKGELARSGENFTLNNPRKRALIKQKTEWLTVDETLFLTSSSCEFVICQECLGLSSVPNKDMNFFYF